MGADVAAHKRGARTVTISLSPSDYRTFGPLASWHPKGGKAVSGRDRGRERHVRYVRIPTPFNS